MKEPVLALLRCGLIVFSPPVVREARLRHRQCWSFFSPSGVSGATERNEPTYRCACGGASRGICALHSVPYPVPFSFPQSTVQWPTAHHLTTPEGVTACSQVHY